MDIQFLAKDQVWQDETTRYWFSVDGETYGISDNCGLLTLLDHEGYPIEEQNDHDNLKDALIPHYGLHIND